MIITKEKNILHLCFDGKTYHYDINTGLFYGVKTTPLKRTPSGFITALEASPHPADTPIFLLMRTLFDPNTRCTPCYSIGRASQFAEYSIFLDKIIALGYTSLMSTSYFETSCKYSEYLGKYYNVKGHNHLGIFNFHDFVDWCQQQEWKKQIPMLNSLDENELQAVCNYFRSYHLELPQSKKEKIIYYIHNQRLIYAFSAYDRWLAPNIVCEYLDRCEFLGKEPVGKCNNFLRELAETNKAYEIAKAEYDIKRFTANYKAQANAWNFTYGDYTVVIPTEGKDLIIEGQRMHHCVGSYVNQVVEGKYFICFIRKTSDINIPYITCQVYPNGMIGQYYLAYDCHISDPADVEFARKFQEHLRDVWNR